MLDFDKMEVILTFNSTFLKINVKTFNFFSWRNYSMSQCSENITQCLHVQQHRVQYLVALEFSVLWRAGIGPSKKPGCCRGTVWTWGCCGLMIFWFVFNATVYSCCKIWNIRSSGYFFIANTYGKQGQLVSVFTEFLMCEVIFVFCYFLFDAA